MKQIRRILLIIISVVMSNVTYAQNSMEDVIYLKNGSVIRGIIIEQIPNVSIKVQTKDRNVFVFKMEEIEKMAKEVIPDDISKPKTNDYKKKGYINITELGLGFGAGEFKVDGVTFNNTEKSYGIRMVNGFLLNEHISLGLGVGIEKYTVATLIPITMDTRAFLVKGAVTPVIGFNWGYSIGLNDEKAGLMYNPSIGIRARIANNTSFLLSIGYKWQTAVATYSRYNYWTYYYDSYSQEITLQFLTLNAGFSF